MKNSSHKLSHCLKLGQQGHSERRSHFAPWLLANPIKAAHMTGTQGHETRADGQAVETVFTVNTAKVWGLIGLGWASQMGGVGGLWAHRQCLGGQSMDVYKNNNSISYNNNDSDNTSHMAVFILLQLRQGWRANSRSVRNMGTGLEQTWWVKAGETDLSEWVNSVLNSHQLWRERERRGREMGDAPGLYCSHYYVVITARGAGHEAVVHKLRSFLTLEGRNVLVVVCVACQGDSKTRHTPTSMRPRVKGQQLWRHLSCQETDRHREKKDEGTTDRKADIRHLKSLYWTITCPLYIQQKDRDKDKKEK